MRRKEEGEGISEREGCAMERTDDKEASLYILLHSILLTRCMYIRYLFTNYFLTIRSSPLIRYKTILYINSFFTESHPKLKMHLG
jgi:hypothetical protein